MSDDGAPVEDGNPEGEPAETTLPAQGVIRAEGRRGITYRLTFWLTDDGYRAQTVKSSLLGRSEYPEDEMPRDHLEYLIEEYDLVEATT